MLRSLWSGVSGMQAHQIALDVESNNIANVNTVGFNTQVRHLWICYLKLS